MWHGGSLCAKRGRHHTPGVLNATTLYRVIHRRRTTCRFDKKLRSHQHFGLLLGFVGMAIFACTVPMTRVAVGDLDPLFMTALRATPGLRARITR